MPDGLKSVVARNANRARRQGARGLRMVADALQGGAGA